MGRAQVDEIAARVGAAARQFGSGYRPTAGQTASAASVLRDMVAAVEQHGLTLADFDAVADFPRLVIQLIQQRDAQV